MARSIRMFFERLSDPRDDYGKRHQVTDMLTITILARARNPAMADLRIGRYIRSAGYVTDPQRRVVVRSCDRAAQRADCQE